MTKPYLEIAANILSSIAGDKILLGGISLMSTEFLLKFYEIEMLKRWRIYEKFLKRNLECKLMA